MASGRTQPQPGDLTEISPLGYEHGAMYVGNDYVVHLAAPSEVAGAGVSSSKSLEADRATVKKELLSVVARGDKYRVNSKHDEEYEPRPCNKIIQQAEKLVGREVPYSMESQNFEHFMNALHYRIPCSDQGTDTCTDVKQETVSSVCSDIIAFVETSLATMN